MESLLSIPLEIAVEKLAKFIGEQIELFASASEDLREITDTLRSIKAVLVDGERKQMTNESVRVWLSKLKSIALDIEDVVDEWQISSGGSPHDYDHSKVRSTCLPLTPACFEPSVVSRHKVGVRVKEIRKRLDAIDRERHMFSFSSSSGGGESETMHFSSDWRQTSSFVEESEIIGRDKEKERVISWLVSDADDGQQQTDVHVTAIVGVGGLGKTTLAQQIFNDPKVKGHFGQQISSDPKGKDHFAQQISNDKQALYWVCVSHPFNVKKLIKDILKAVNGREGGASSSTQLNDLQNELVESLKGKRFLLVLDDIWNEVPEKWETLRLSLKSGAQGSRILVTTRSEKVAEIMNASSHIHKLEGLTEDLSWELFCRRAFPGKIPKEFAEFESIGRGIVKKCKGVPLSIKMMGSTMKEKTTMADWRNILESEMWSLPDVKDGILPSLQLSYYNLPPQLKQCFAYCSIYQKDEEMKKNELVSLWVAQGFIRPEGNREIEDVAEEYFNGLVARSMFQEVYENSEGYTTCRMHDLLHDLATFITQDESYIFTTNKMPNPQCSSIDHVRHASLFLTEENASISTASCPAKKLRTLFLYEWDEITGVHDKLFRQARFLRALAFSHGAGVKVPSKAIGKLKHLRYLDLSRSSIAKLPPKTIKKLKFLRYLKLSRSSIVELPPETIERLNLLRYLDLSSSLMKKLPDAFGKMEQLRYLNLSNTEIKELPESTSNLVNLHTLNLTGCRMLKNLCGGMSRIIGLRHLYIRDTWKLEFLPKGIGKLTSLQSLCKFIVGRNEGECEIDELQELNSIQGSLEIKGLDRVSDAEQAVRAQLYKKQYVRELVLDISSSGRGAEDDKKEERIKVLECLRPHTKLQDLSLKGNSISKLTLPCWMGDPSFSNLSSIFINGFRNQWNPNSTMPGLGKLPRLKRLEIWKVGVRKLGDEFYYGIGMMSSSNDSVGQRRGVAFPRLESLTLKLMFELEEWELTGEADALNVMPSLRELVVSKCRKLQLLPSHLTSTPSSSTEALEETKNYCDELKSLPPDPHHVLIPLERLDIFACGLQLLPHSLGQLKKLQSLSISVAEELEILPDALGQLTSLEFLEIDRCNKLKSLPASLGQLHKLKELRISYCKELGSLPDSLQHLPLLQELRIVDCSQLPYPEEGRREDWPQISNIQRIVINGRQWE